MIDAVKKNDDGDPLDAFDNKTLKEELKKAKKGSAEQLLLKKVESLINNKTSLAKELKIEEKEFDDAVQDRIITLTNDEIDRLMYQKWFGDTTKQMVGLIEVSLKNELEERYSSTLFEIDLQIESMMSDFETLKNELVVE